MEFICMKGRRKYYIHVLGEQEIDFLSPFEGHEFIALVACTTNAQTKVLSSLPYLLEQNLRYIMCFGDAAE